MYLQTKNPRILSPRCHAWILSPISLELKDHKFAPTQFFHLCDNDEDLRGKGCPIDILAARNPRNAYKRDVNLQARRRISKVSEHPCIELFFLVCRLRRIQEFARATLTKASQLKQFILPRLLTRSINTFYGNAWKMGRMRTPIR